MVSVVPGLVQNLKLNADENIRRRLPRQSCPAQGIVQQAAVNGKFGVLIHIVCWNGLNLRGMSGFRSLCR